MSINTSAIIVQSVEEERILSSGVELSVLRLDLVHPYISGNKWYKLKYNIEEMRKEGKDTLLTFGGAYSNHIAATAAAGKEFGFNTIGIIRGEETIPLNPTLLKANDNGMKLYYVSREKYRTKTEEGFVVELKKIFGDFYLVPEGGSNILGVKGCLEILKERDKDFDFVCCAIGTGATLAGIALSASAKVLGFSSLKGGKILNEEVKRYTKENVNNWSINVDYHFGGYAKTTQQLIDFINEFELKNNIPIDQVYTGKMMFGIYDLIEKGFFSKGSKILAIHTGGLQGKG